MGPISVSTEGKSAQSRTLERGAEAHRRELWNRSGSVFPIFKMVVCAEFHRVSICIPLYYTANDTFGLGQGDGLYGV